MSDFLRLFHRHLHGPVTPAERRRMGQQTLALASLALLIIALAPMAA